LKSGGPEDIHGERGAQVYIGELGQCPSEVQEQLAFDRGVGVKPSEAKKISAIQTLHDFAIKILSDLVK
jgi:hypothetical protein